MKFAYILIIAACNGQYLVGKGGGKPVTNITTTTTNVMNKNLLNIITIEGDVNAPVIVTASLGSIGDKKEFTSIPTLKNLNTIENSTFYSFNLPPKNAMIGFSFTPTQGELSESSLSKRERTRYLPIKILMRTTVTKQVPNAYTILYYRQLGSDTLWEEVGRLIVPKKFQDQDITPETISLDIWIKPDGTIAYEDNGLLKKIDDSLADPTFPDKKKKTLQKIRQELFDSTGKAQLKLGVKQLD